jgi:hypothetical protein
VLARATDACGDCRRTASMARLRDLHSLSRLAAPVTVTARRGVLFSPSGEICVGDDLAYRMLSTLSEWTWNVLPALCQLGHDTLAAAFLSRIGYGVPDDEIARHTGAAGFAQGRRGIIEYASCMQEEIARRFGGGGLPAWPLDVRACNAGDDPAAIRIVPAYDLPGGEPRFNHTGMSICTMTRFLRVFASACDNGCHTVMHLIDPLDGRSSESLTPPLPPPLDNNDDDDVAPEPRPRFDYEAARCLMVSVYSALCTHVYDDPNDKTFAAFYMCAPASLTRFVRYVRAARVRCMASGWTSLRNVHTCLRGWISGMVRGCVSVGNYAGVEALLPEWGGEIAADDGPEDGTRERASLVFTLAYQYRKCGGNITGSPSQVPADFFASDPNEELIRRRIELFNSEREAAPESAEACDVCGLHCLASAHDRALMSAAARVLVVGGCITEPDAGEPLVSSARGALYASFLINLVEFVPSACLVSRLLDHLPGAYLRGAYQTKFVSRSNRFVVRNTEVTPVEHVRLILDGLRRAKQRPRHLHFIEGCYQRCIDVIEKRQALAASEFVARLQQE